LAFKLLTNPPEDMNETHLRRFDGLNEFDEAVILSVGLLGKMAYGLQITELLESQTGRTISIAKVHVALFKLERKGILISALRAPTLELGGNIKKIYSICDSRLNGKALDGPRSVCWN
jgi:PadR family transcriptional regulator, regulatory protein PadR